MNTEMTNKMEELLGFTKKAGATDGDIILSRGESFSLSAQNNDIDKYKVSGACTIGVRAIVEDKIGLAYSESLDSDALEYAANKAVSNAKCSVASPHEKIRQGAVSNKHTEEKIEGPSVQEKIDFCLSLEADVKARDKRVSAVPYNGYSEGFAEKYYLNSNGASTYQSSNYFSCYTSALIKDGDASSMHYHGVMAKSFVDLNKKECVDESYTHALNWLEGKSVETGKYDVIFTIDCLEDLLGCFSNIFSGQGAMEKNNPFGEKLGQIPLSSKLTISDLPQYENAFKKYYFDDEGYTQEDLVLVENGMLKNFYHNTKTADFFGGSTTARASRGAKSSLGVSGTNIVISQGDTLEADLRKGRYFEIHSMQGLHSGANNISGNFSFAATGYLKEGDEIIQAVKGVTVAGNFHQMLKEISLVGNELFTTSYRSFFAPTLRFQDMSIAG